jgi:PB1 domain
MNDQQLGLNLEQLRTQIRECFNMDPIKDFGLSYVDIDGDTVLLLDDSDLYDAAIKQGLNPVRIKVELKHSETKKHEMLQSEINTRKKAETITPVSNLIGASGAVPSAEPLKQAQDKPESSHGQLTVHHVIKCYGCGQKPIRGVLYKSMYVLISVVSYFSVIYHSCMSICCCFQLPGSSMLFMFDYLFFFSKLENKYCIYLSFLGMGIIICVPSAIIRTGYTLKIVLSVEKCQRILIQPRHISNQFLYQHGTPMGSLTCQ